ncbi:MAG: hypothetical protein ACP5FH_11885, partial [Terracidiphilus sp.]
MISEPPETRSGQPELDGMAPAEGKYRGLHWIFFGDQGLRSGWSVTIFSLLIILFGSALESVFFRL